MSVRLRAPAKVNLFLRILSREASGYHRIETLFHALELHDTVTVRPRGDPGVALELTGEEAAGLGPPGKNLVVRAARAFLDRAGLVGEGGLEIGLEKKVPAGAGLGGGSSDAAAVLRILDRLHPGVVAREALAGIGLELGSDVPFFLGASTLALGWGRGERLLALPPPERRSVVVAAPETPVATTKAYEALATLRQARDEPDARARLRTGEDLTSWEGIARGAVNDFEELVFDEHPVVRAIRDQLAEAGAAPALLSGSGSAVFGVFADAGRARTAADAVGEAHAGARVIVTATLTGWPEPEGV